MIKFNPTELYSQFKKEDLRVELHNENESLGKKIRNAKTQRIPYLIIVGEEEIKNKTITVEGRNDQKLKEIKTEEFIKKIKGEIKERR